jgi:hypothetical protein
MSVRTHRLPHPARAALFGLGLVVVGTASTLAVSTPVEALPRACILRTYYSDADMTDQVGTWSNCPGSGGLHGRRTAYYETDTVELSTPKPIGGGGMPCEFVQENDPFTGKPLTDYTLSQCNNIPTPRFQ